MPGALRVGTIAGIKIYLHVSWFVIFVLLSWSLATGWSAVFPGWSPATYWVLSVLAALLLFVSVLLHELSHSLVARARGLAVNSITLFIFGGVSNIEQEPKRPGVEFQMAFVGPLTSLAISGLSFLLLLPMRGSASPLAALLAYLAAANLLLGIFNLIPGFPLDGGRVLRSIVWALTGNLRTATRVATLVGQIIAYVMICSGLLLLFNGVFLDGLWLGFVGWFLLSGASSANTLSRLETIFAGVAVGQVMSTQPVTVPSNISLQRLVYEYLLPHAWRHAFVIQIDRLVGLVTLSDIRHVSQEEWSRTLVTQVMIPREKLYTASPEQPLRDVFTLMVTRGINQIPVVQDEQLVGVLSREDLLRFVEIRRSLGLEKAA